MPNSHSRHRQQNHRQHQVITTVNLRVLLRPTIHQIVTDKKIDSSLFLVLFQVFSKHIAPERSFIYFIL